MAERLIHLRGNGIPQISTRVMQTTVALKENEKLVIGGLIQDNPQRTESMIPILGECIKR